jgi:hypothetical protein
MLFFKKTCINQKKIISDFKYFKHNKHILWARGGQPMSCFLKQKDKIFLLPFEGIEQILLSVENAIVEKTDTFWVIKEIKQGEKLNKRKHFFIKDGIVVEQYCRFCLFRLRAMNKGCNTCVFNPVNLSSFEKMNIDSLIFSLRKKGCYEVDSQIFKEEIRVYKHQQKLKQKSK